MRVLLISSNRERSPFPVAPLGALAVAGAAEAAGHQVELLDLMHARWPERAVRQAVRRGDHDVVGLSIRNLDNCMVVRPVHYLEQVAGVARQISDNTSAPLVLGGGGFTVSPGGWLRRLPACCGVVGEGEQAFVAVLARLDGGEPLDGLPGVMLPGDSAAPPATLADVAGLPPPAHKLCDYRTYLSTGGFVGVQTKRGCAFSCSYCTYPQLEGSTVRLRPVEQVVEEMERVVRAPGSRIRSFYITDGVFNAPRSHALAFCRQLISRGLGLQWMAYCNPVGLDLELAQAMGEAGCVGIELGVDAVTDGSLEAANKPFTAAQARASMAAIHQAGVPLGVFLLFGFPGETARDVHEAGRFIDDCAPAHAVFASAGVRVFAGTAIEGVARQQGQVSEQDDLFSPVFYCAEGLGSTPMRTLDEVAAARVCWSTPTDWARRRLHLVQGMCNRLGQRPQWLNIAFYGRYLR